MYLSGISVLCLQKRKEKIRKRETKNKGKIELNCRRENEALRTIMSRFKQRPLIYIILFF
jgi:hypothetical protein